MFWVAVILFGIITTLFSLLIPQATPLFVVLAAFGFGVGYWTCKRNQELRE